MLRSATVITCLTLLAASGCKDKDPEVKQPDMKLKRQHEQLGRKTAANGNQARRRTIKAPQVAAWTPEQRGQFCSAVFDKSNVNSLLGFDADALNQLQSATPQSPARTARCQYTLPGQPKRPPRYEALLMIDCRRGMIHNQAMTRRAFMSGKKPDKLESVSIGAGGTYGSFRVTMGTYKAPIHQINFVHQNPTCTVTVRTRFMDADHVQALARYVDRRINTSNAPY